jgi:DNA mismatch repair ATPase MutS
MRHQRLRSGFRNQELLMSNDDPQKQAGIARLTSDLRAAKIELLSAQCATDRLRLQYSVADLVSFGELRTLKAAIASADALCRYFSSVEQALEQADPQARAGQ